MIPVGQSSGSNDAPVGARRTLALGRQLLGVGTERELVTVAGAGLVAGISSAVGPATSTAAATTRGLGRLVFGGDLAAGQETSPLGTQDQPSVLLGFDPVLGVTVADAALELKIGKKS